LKLLLDTHIWLWSKSDPGRLGKRVAEALASAANELWLSPVSVWEVLTLAQKRRIGIEDPLGWVESAASQMIEAPLTQEIIRASFVLSLPHADPADRFLAATAKVLNLTLVTADKALLGLGEIASMPNR
jgi:PIN domain nuclease of toxin-antitoxin system